MNHQATLTTEPKHTTGLSETLNIFFLPTVVNIGVIERLASLAVGVAVVLIIARRLLLYLGLAGVSGYLIYRGATGYCPLYASEQIDTRGWRPRWREFERSENYEQDNSTREMATRAGRPENGVGPTHGQ